MEDIDVEGLAVGELAGGSDYYRGPQWWPIAVLRELHRSAGMRAMGLAWLLASFLAVATGILSVKWDWYRASVEVGGITIDLTIYPPLLITFLLAVWVGPAWAVPPAFVTTLLLARYSGMSWDSSALFALASPVEVLVFWGSMVILNVSPELRRWRDLLWLLVVGLVACVASSVAVPIWNAQHDLDALAGQEIWRGWVIGAFAQVVLLLAPILKWAGTPARFWLARRMPEPSKQSTSLGNSITLVVVIFLMLAGLLVTGVVLLAGSLDAGTTARDLPPKHQVLRELGLSLGISLGTMLLTLVVFSAALARLSERQRRQALIDPLTGCLNRRAFDSIFRREAERSRRLGKGISLILFDVDRFKRINDVYGHQTGDEVLRRLAIRARLTLRLSDLLFRWGGEEFVVLLPHTEPSAARSLAERLRTVVRSSPLVEEKVLQPLSITLSVGTAGTWTPPETADDLLARADAACYVAKRGGGDQVAADPVDAASPDAAMTPGGTT
jgi:diguanylate cyclase (GGDEF)-like protein